MNQQSWHEVAVDQGFQVDPRGWLSQCMGPDRRWLLVHADDGVIWGRREPDGTLRLSSDVFDVKGQYPALAVELRAETLQQARVFGPEGEILVWREGGGFKAREIAEGVARPAAALNDGDEDQDERQLLWGLGEKRTVKEGFTLLSEGAQGPHHAVPCVIAAGQRPALLVRHYVDYDDEGQAYVAMSRLVDLASCLKEGRQ